MKTKMIIFFLLAISIVTVTLTSPTLFCAEEIDSLQTITLVPPNLERGMSLMHALNERKSRRSFSAEELSAEMLSNLLWAACGVNRPEGNLLTTPTAHNWQEIEVYVAFEKGLYFYNRNDHILELVHNKDIREFVGKQKFTAHAPVNLIFVADYKKMDGSKKDEDFYAATAKKMKLPDHQTVILSQPVGYPTE